MKWMVAVSVYFAFAALCLAADIEGQIFTVTGMGAVKFPLVEVRLYRQSDVEAAIKAKMRNAQAKHAVEFFAAEASRIEDEERKEEALLKSKYMLSATYLFEDLPKPIAETISDADGGFQLSAPGKGSYVLVAEVARQVFGTTEVYQWMVKTPAPASRVMLSSHNIAPSGSKESLVHTVSPEEEWRIIQAVGKKKGITGLTLEALTITKRRQMDAAAKAQAEKEEQEGIAAMRKEELQRDLEAFRRDPSLAQKRALERFPALGAKGSALNAKFIELHAAKKERDPGYFTEPDWPIRLAEEAVDTLAAERKTE